MNKLLTLTAVLFLKVLICFGQQDPTMRYEDKIRIREAIQISNQYGEGIWKGINQVPFVVLLVTDSLEFLINHPYPSEDFVLSEDDPILETKIFYRKRKYSPQLLATFPAINGVNCIVVGTPEKTGKSSSKWVITMLHEHFHQYQFNQPDYYSSVDSLGLSGGDQTGMWQLNYPFPYEDSKINRQFQAYNESLIDAISAIDSDNFGKTFKKYRYERERFKKLIDPVDYRYFSFQLWQEGLARYTEYLFLQQLSNYSPSKEMRDLEDFIDFKSLKDEFFMAEISALKNSKLEVNKRVSFYSLGFAEGLLLDHENPFWKDLYFQEKYKLDAYFTKN